MRTIFVGDVHGCLPELRALVARLAPAADDRLVFVGDLVDRGPDPAGVVAYVRSLGGPCILGNHEEKALRWLRHEDRVATGQQARNPMRPPSETRAAEWRSLTADDRAFLTALPVTLTLDVGGEPWVAVHAGLLPGVPLDEQKTDQILRCRWVDEAGRFVPMRAGSREQPPGSFRWAERYDGAHHVVYGHAIMGAEPQCDRSQAGFERWGIDTGCYAGGHLSALVLDHDRPGHREVVQVAAARVYHPRHDDD